MAMDQLNIRDTQPLNVSSFSARQKVTQYVMRELSTQLGGDAPELTVGERVFWSVPVVFTLPGKGVLGRVGTLRVDAATGEMLTDPRTEQEMMDHAEQLARGAYNWPLCARPHPTFGVNAEGADPMKKLRMACILMSVMLLVLAGRGSRAFALEPNPDTRNLIEMFDSDERTAVERISGVKVIAAYRWKGGPLKGYVILTSGKEPKRLDLGEETMTRARDIWKRNKEKGAFDPATIRGTLLIAGTVEKGVIKDFLILEAGYEVSGSFNSQIDKFPVTRPEGGFGGTRGLNTDFGAKLKWWASRKPEGMNLLDFFEFEVERPETGKK